jgi:DNA repair photolyase
MAPIVPGFSTQPRKIEATVKAIADSGATSIGAMVMHMDGGTKDHFMAILQREYPDLVPMYNELYASRYVKKDYERRVQEVVSLMRQRYPPSRSRASAGQAFEDSSDHGGPGD